MARLNLLNLNFGPRTHEGAPARNISTDLQLRRSVLACLLRESQFYEDGVEIAGRIAQLVPKVEAEKVAALAVEAREKMKLRHAPLLLVREMARYATHRGFVAETLAQVIQRADELAEFVAIYWKDGRVPLSAQVKKGLAAAFPKFDAYALAVLLREIGEKVAVFSFSDTLAEVPARRGFALRDAIDKSQRHNSTQLGKAVTELNEAAMNQKHGYDRLIVITDEQAHDTVPGPRSDGRLRPSGYVINVASNKNGVGYGKWTHIDGWSESVVEYIRTMEQAHNQS
jgi:hypothetical protein